MVYVFKNCTICYELCDQMRFEVACAKSHHHVISDGLFWQTLKLKRIMLTKSLFILLFKETMKSCLKSIMNNHEELKGMNLFL